ncbi:hypothetical protein P4S72_16295 [Vibrio sp. PP-XX7]
MAGPENLQRIQKVDDRLIVELVDADLQATSALPLHFNPSLETSDLAT